MAGGGGHPLAGKDALHRRPDHLVHEAFRSSAVTEEIEAAGSGLVSLYPHQPLPFTPTSTILRSSRESHHEEVFPPGIDFATKAIRQECSPGGNLQDPFIPQQPQALLCSAYCLEYLIPGTQERETVCHHWPQHQYGQEQVLSG